MPVPLRGVLLDIDGTLVDSNDANARAWMQALVSHGFEINYIKLREAIGMGGDNLLPRVVRIDSDSPEGEAVSKTRSEIMKSQYMPHLQSFPQVKALLTRMHAQGLKLVVVTSAKSDEADILLQTTGASDLIDVIATTEDAESSKPAPDILQAALKKSGLAAESVVMLGDTPYDVQAAGKANVRILGVRCGGWAAPDLQGAEAVYDDPADLLARYDDSVFVH